MYKLQKYNGVDVAVLRLADNISIPLYVEGQGGVEYQQYLAWLAEGNQPLPADDPTEN